MSKSGKHPARVEEVARELRPVVRAALAAGWTLTRSGSAHPKLTDPDGRYATPLPTSTANLGLIRRIRTNLRRRGVEC